MALVEYAPAPFRQRLAGPPIPHLLNARYRATFTTYASLIDLKSQKSVALAACNYFPESIVGAATYEEMLIDDAKRLKQDLAAGTNYCAQELTKKLLPN